MLRPVQTPPVRATRTGLCLAAFGAICVSVNAATIIGTWDSRFFLTGIQGEVRSIATGVDEVYVGGQFFAADALAVTNIASWSGTNWAALAGGVNGAVNAMAVHDGVLYAGGEFSSAGAVSANRIARWDGANWSALGDGIEGTRLAALAVDAAGALYAGGEFTNAGGVAVANIARWDGANWSALGSGLRNDPYAAWVLALATRGTDLYAGRFFTDAGGVNVSCIAKWNGTNWSALGAGVDDLNYLPQVTALAVNGNDLFAGGAFTKAGNVSAAHVARWDGVSWSALGGGLTRFFGDIPVAALAVSGGDLLVGGRFETAGGVSATNLARWNGTAWTELGGGASGSVKAIMVTDGVYLGGAFTVTNASRTTGLARWNGSEWTTLSAGGGKGVYGPRNCVLLADCFGDDVAALVPDGQSLVAAGGFVLAGDVVVNNVARWDGTNWSPLGSGVNGHVRALARNQTALYAAGRFRLFGDTTSSNVARWNGAAWLPLGGGLNGPVHALALKGTDLYAGGSFSVAGGVAASNVARWDGTNWSALGSGVNGAVYALVVSGGVLFAGGRFTAAGALVASNVACWDGSQWVQLGNGVGGVVNSLVRVRPPPVSALAVRGNELFVGGDFAWAGGVAATNVARWDGTNWFALGAGVLAAPAFAPPPSVTVLVVSASELYVGGSFGNAGGLSARNLARWDGSQWIAFNDGVDGGAGSWPTVEALALEWGQLYIGGHFKFAGDKPAAGFAIWSWPQRPRLAIFPVGDEFVLSWPAAAGSYVLQASEDLPAGQWQSVTNASALLGDQIVVTNKSPKPVGFFRLIQN